MLPSVSLTNTFLLEFILQTYKYRQQEQVPHKYLKLGFDSLILNRCSICVTFPLSIINCRGFACFVSSCWEGGIAMSQGWISPVDVMVIPQQAATTDGIGPGDCWGISQQVECWWLVTHPALGVNWGSPGQRSRGCHMARERCAPTDSHSPGEAHNYNPFLCFLYCSAGKCSKLLEGHWPRIRKHTADFLCLFS